MPEIKFQVNIQGGKRTGTYVSTTANTENDRMINFINGAVMSESELMAIVGSAIRKAINERGRMK